MKRFLLALLLLVAGPALAATYYFSDCQSGAHASCVAGDNTRSAATAQTSTTPWQTTAAIATHLSGIDSVPAGTVFRFARGGKWTSFELIINNLNATSASPIVFDVYTPSWGGSDDPWLVCGTTACFQFSESGSTLDGGYTIRDFKIQGSTTQWCVGIFDNTRDVVLENVEIYDCILAVYSVNTATKKNWYAALRNSNIHNNSEQGMLGAFHYGVVEFTAFANNAFDEPAGFGHNMYIGVEDGATNFVVRYNTFTGPGSTSGGACSNGNITGHGQLDGLLLEGNTITSTSVGAGCGSININPAYPSSSPPEYCRNCIIRGNTIVDAAGNAISVSGAPGVIIENNKIVATGTAMQYGIIVPGRVSSGGGIFDNAYDDADSGAIIRNNGCYFTAPASGAICIRTENSLGPIGSGVSVAGNLAWFATASGTQTCWGNNTTLANYALWDGNLCFGADAWTNNYSTHSLAHAAGLDTWSSAGGLADNDPLFVAAPASGNSYSFTLQSGSPALNVGVSGMSRRAFGSKTVTTSRDTGPEDLQP